MCLAIPGKILSITGGDDPMSKMARVDFGGIIKNICLAYVPDAEIGEYMVVHVGFAISRVHEQEALKVFEYLKEIGELEELEAEG